jgi:undecaprenyl diphosphate synthase
MSKLQEMLVSLFHCGVVEVSVYLLSKKNLRRTQAELDSIAEAESRFVLESLPQVRREHKFRLQIAGLWRLAPSKLRSALEAVPPADDSADRVVTLVVAYDPVDEIIHLCHSSLAITPNQLRSRLWVPTPLDLVIRTGGAITLSDFLPLQASYARIRFLEVLFNDLSVEELMRIVEEHDASEHKFGQ